MSVSCQKNLTITVNDVVFNPTIVADKSTARQGEVITVSVTGMMPLDNSWITVAGQWLDPTQVFAFTADGSGNATVKVWARQLTLLPATLWVGLAVPSSNTLTIAIVSTTGPFTDTSGFIAWMVGWNTAEGHGAEFTNNTILGTPSPFGQAWNQWWQNGWSGTFPTNDLARTVVEDGGPGTPCILRAMTYVGGVQFFTEWGKTNDSFGLHYPAGTYALTVDPTGSAPATATLSDYP